MADQYEYIWRNKWLTSDAKTIEEMALILKSAATKLEQMSKDGIKLDLETSNGGDDYHYLCTEDPAIAEKYGFERYEPENWA